MSKKIIIAAVVLMLAAAAVYTLVILNFHDPEKHTAEITVDGKVIRTIDLSTAPDETFTVESGYGTNVVCIKDGEIFVSEASCPDKICINHGPLKSEYLPIICLPNKFVIELK